MTYIKGEKPTVHVIVTKYILYAYIFNLYIFYSLENNVVHHHHHHHHHHHNNNNKQLWHSHEVDMMFYGAKKTHIDRGRRPRLIFVFCAP